MALEPPPTQAMTASGKLPSASRICARASRPMSDENRAPWWDRVRAEHAAEHVVRGADVGDPVAHGFVDGIFESARAGVDAADFGSEQAHAVDVGSWRRMSSVPI